MSSGAVEPDDSSGSTGGDGSSLPPGSTPNLASLDKVSAYIQQVASVLLDADGEDENGLILQATLRQNAENIGKFIGDHHCKTLLVERALVGKDEELDPDRDGADGASPVVVGGSVAASGEKAAISYQISINVQFSSPRMTSVVFVKKAGVLEAEKGIAGQMRVITLSDGSPYETLHSYVSTAVAPYFKSFVRESGKADRDGDKMATSMEKKIAELEMGLLHLQQNIDIPEITLQVHPLVAQAIKQAESENRKPKVDDLRDRVEDSTFLNNLQNLVSKWIREIQKVTKLDRDPSNGTALQEISFWLNLERALLRIQEKRESSDVALTLDILKHGKRFHATVSFDTDTGLKQAISLVNDYNPLMKDFPINDLLSATELERIRTSIQAIFSHLRKIRNTKYPIQRALRLVEAISRDLSNQMLKVLSTRRLMLVSFDEFEKVMLLCTDVFSTWDDEYDKLQGLMRDIVKRKRDEHLKMVWRVNFAHKRLQARIDQMRKFRRQHEQLRTVIVRVLRPATTGFVPGLVVGEEEQAQERPEALAMEAADSNAIEEVNLAYENVKVVDGLDVTKEGTDAWEAALKRYEDRIDRVETRITSRLRDQLGTAKNANEMFRIFSRFNALFVRPHIRGAIREYQTQLIQRVKDDIEALHTKFKIQYPQSKAYKMSQVRDLPPIAGSIIWAKQIDRQLTAYMRRVEDVLGRGWENHVEGQKLKADGDSFRMKLNTQEIFEDWARKVQQRNLQVSGRIFTIETVRNRSGKNTLKLKVNFLPEIIQLAKEVRNLKNLGFRVPLAVVNKAHQANQLYPFAISLIESVRTYERSLEKMEKRPNIALLVAGLRKEVQGAIAEGIGLVWESYKLDPYVQRLADIVVQFQEKVDYLLVIDEQIDIDVRSLESCVFSAASFKGILEKIQASVDDLSLQQYSNLHAWVSKLDEEVEAKLAARLGAGIEAWTKALKGKLEEDLEDTMDTESPSQPAHKLGGDPQLKKLLHDIRITNQIMYMYPSLEDCRSLILKQFFAWQAVVTSQEKIQSTRYQVGLDRPTVQTYRDLLTKIPKETIENAYTEIEDILEKVKVYVREWLNYQALWDLQSDTLVTKFGDNIDQWMKLLTDIKKSRATFDTSDTKKEIGPVIIDYGKVQSKVSVKYDSWHKDALAKFGGILSNEMATFHSQISKARVNMEQQTIEAASTSEAVNFITDVQSLKKKMKNWDKQVSAFKDGQRILERQRFQFPTSWLHVDNVEGEWGAFNEIIKRKNSSIQNQVASLQMKITAEDKQVEARSSDYIGEWEKGKPVDGQLQPAEALQKIQMFENRFVKLKEDRDNVCKAKEALEIEETVSSSNLGDKLTVGWEELQDLKGVWSELAKIWEQIDEMKDLPWLSVQTRKLRQQIDALLTQLKDLPSRLRQYAGYEHVRKLLQTYAKVNVLIVELKSDALKERHWKTICKELRVQWVLSDLTLGQVWDVDLLKNEPVIRDVISVAQGEMALEEFLKQVKETWQTYELDLVNYQNKCKLIKGWDDLFNKLKENITQVAAMKLSPYYRVFEEEAATWEDKLNRISNLFDVWIDVQRRWVYLEGIFTGNADIGNLLPVETSRFNSISAEFLALMKKVTKSRMVMDILNIQGIQRSLERLADLLTKVQKALGEYLERERASFPRFYFVGDEDLLEIIGNSKNVSRLQKHFKKMFAGISSIILDEEGTLVMGIASKEGEEVMFEKPVSLVENPRINDWLTEVEKSMKLTLVSHLAKAVADSKTFEAGSEQDKFLEWCDKYCAQIIVLATQIIWTEQVEQCLSGSKSAKEEMGKVLEKIEQALSLLSDLVLYEQPPIRRKKLEHLIYEYVHRRTITRDLIKKGIDTNKSFEWLSHMRFYLDTKKSELQQLSIHMADAQFLYGFEYLGVQDRLVMTPLTDRCYLTMTQALSANLGGSPFGPAGTGKTETVKALGNQLGRFVLVFNCDETFDFQAMGRIFVGLCQVGAWGCFDEFNRLEERMLSAVSQQIQTIQECLRAKNTGSQDQDKLTIELVGKQINVNPDMAIFVTMNPGYAGRSNLPDNLKKLFRSLAMTRPGETLIAEVMLFSQGFRTAEKLSKKIVPLFKLCAEQLSPQSHYDFGLRALKSVLVSAGNVKREKLKKNENETGDDVDEQTILVQSVCETMVPKLVAEDIPLLQSLTSDVFPGVAYGRQDMEELRQIILQVSKEQHLVAGAEEEEIGYAWMEKILQLYQITELHHGLMMVGPSGSGKSSAWRTLLTALERFDKIEGRSHVIDPKALSKEELYGSLDPNTREWKDGLFTHILRKIIDNVRGESGKRQWIIFDGDVDPEWVENLNSVLDNNKLLTLPNGERLSIPPNVRIMFEVQDLKFATPATVSRCGMVWFSEEVLTPEMIMTNYLLKLRKVSLDDSDDDVGKGDGSANGTSSISVQNEAANILAPYLTADGLVTKCLEHAVSLQHIMDYTKLRALGSLFSMLNQTVRNILQYNHTHMDFPMPSEQMEKYVSKCLVQSILWSFTGDSKTKYRQELGKFIHSICTIPLPDASTNILDFEVTIEGSWIPWTTKVPVMEVETHKVGSPDIVVPTIDTVRHESLLFTWLADHKPMVLCGPPGSGKTMTLFAALRSLPDMEVVGLNFSSATTPELLLKTFDHYCEYRKTPNGMVLAPTQLGKWLIMFCDEINLPDMDNYGTQRVISFLRQLVEHNGFYRTSDQSWVSLERIQFVGACNPPTDPGRKPLSHRFLRHVPVIYVDYPGEASLKQIYCTFNRALLRLIPPLRTYAEPLTNAMVDFFLKSQERFTQDMQPHYVYSPREMTRWVRGIYEAIKPLETLSVDGLVRLWAHEALRLFHDRLVHDEERLWTNENIDQVALKHFPSIDKNESLKRPILFSNWMTKNYIPVDRDELRDYVKARLKVFYEEELDVPLVLFHEVLDHVLRIDRIFHQQQGHLLLIGVSGSGKTTLSRFVAWINGLSVFQIKVHNKYSAEDFDEDLRQVLRRAGCRNEKICFILDESNVMDSSFLERMNTLLANGEVPGLFEGDEYATLMTQCKEGAQKEGLMLDSSDELYKWFTAQVLRNLHIVFTMNPSENGLKDRAATSPALFNRCVLNWFGDWADSALYQVGKELTLKMDLDKANWKNPDFQAFTVENIDPIANHRDAVVSSMVYVHKTLHQVNAKAIRRGQRIMAITPRHFLDFISHFVKLYHEKRSGLEEEQLHLNVGLSKIAETVEQVEEMQKSLAVKSVELQSKNEAANAKLKQMVKNQQEAERQKTQSQEISKLLEKQKVEIAQKRQEVMQDLEQVEPAVLEAQQAVKSIKKQHLVEVRSMANPPSIVKLALESICLLLGENATDWKAIRSVTMKDNFISTIVNFDTDNISSDVREKMKSKYLSNPDYTFDKVNRASMACGPMVKWAIAQLQYSDMLNKVEPLRNELKELEEASNVKQEEADNMKVIIEKLEESINSYKEEYAQLISQAEAIKSDLKQVQDKVDRSMSLLKSLGIEKDRWQMTSESFKSQMSTLIGDVFLSSAFLAYAGYFDQHSRQMLFSTWKSHLDSNNISYRSDFARTEFLSDPDERVSWQANALPTDDLCTENAIMLKRFNRFPLIIDPSGQATEFIMNEYKDKKITKTSFLDDSFRKNLESALRFGNPLLVQDVENYDPILNPVLNRELRRTGGRVLITLADQDIDLSPSFTIILSTRDPTVEFRPDVCSRVTMVNFTVTRSSLQMQCLNQVLKTERPDIDQKRSDLLKLQGEFQLRLRHLEKNLLQVLNEAKGRILDDNTVISTLETLKKEAAEVSKKVDETEEVMVEIDKTSKQYFPLSTACSSIYFTMDSLHQIHFLYQFSLQLFLDIFNHILTNEKALEGVTDYDKRLTILTHGLFEQAYHRVSRGMMHQDKIVLAILLCRIYLRGFNTSENFEAEFQFLLTGKEGSKDKEAMNLEEGLAMLKKKLSAFKDLDTAAKDPKFESWIKSSNPEDGVPSLWTESEAFSAERKAMYELICIHALRPDRFIASAKKFVGSVLGQNIVASTELDLIDIVENEIKGNTPVLMCSVAGYDASDRVMDLATQSGKPLSSIAIGSAEGFLQAEKSINTSIKSGRWVLLKNVHLAPSWLVSLEKKLHSIQAHPGFRLFLTCEVTPKIPVNLLRAGRIFMFEPPPGVKANLCRTFATIPASRMMKPPNERARLYFMLAWLHAVVQERLRYAPIGWSKSYEFNESDLRVACEMLDTWVDTTSQGRTNLPPDKVPWQAVQVLLGKVIYGGKIDSDYDQQLLDTFVKKLFNEKVFDPDYFLIKNSEFELKIPEGIRRDQFLAWIDNLEDKQSPAWLGLPNNVERLLLIQQSNAVVVKMLRMQQIDDEEEGDMLDMTTGVEKPKSDMRPGWMKTLGNSVTSWLSELPKELPLLKRTAENIKDPLFRFFEREIRIGRSILVKVREDLSDLEEICQGAKRTTNYHRDIGMQLVKGIIPPQWKKFTIPLSMTVVSWVANLSRRLEQLQEIVNVSKQGTSSLRSFNYWLGGLFNPDAFITATRQCIAQANFWSLEDLKLSLLVSKNDAPASLDDFSFGVKRLKLYGASCDDGNALQVTRSSVSELEQVKLQWSLRSNEDSKSDAKSIILPVYLNSDRTEILVNVEFELMAGQEPSVFIETGVAFLANA